MKKDIIKNDNGISLVTVIITVIVIIILSSIVIYSQLNTADSALYSKFVQEFEEVNKSVETVRLSDAREDINKLNDSFGLVKISGSLPIGFEPIDGNQAYLVDLSVIGCDDMVCGRDYTKIGDSIVFGETDVYVYDANGKLFYVKGFKKDGVIQYSDVKLAIQILGITYVSDDNTEDKSSKMTIEVRSDNEIKKITINGKEQTTWDSVNNGENGIYTYVIGGINDGIYNIVVEDKNKNFDKKTVYVKYIDTEGLEISVTVLNGSHDDDNDKYKIINDNVAHLKVTATKGSPRYMYITAKDEEPQKWLSYAEYVDSDLDYNEEQRVQQLYVWLKNEAQPPSIVSIPIKIELVKEKTEKPHYEDVIVAEQGEIKFVVKKDDGTICGENEWAKSKKLEITYSGEKIFDSNGRINNGYELSYTMNTGFGKKKYLVNGKQTTIDIKNNGTRVSANIAYKTIYRRVDSVAKHDELLIDYIDPTPPQILSCTFNKQTNTVSAKVTDDGSGLAGYVVTQDASMNTSKIWKSFYQEENTGYIQESEINSAGYWHIYVKDNVGNIAIKSVYCNVSDNVPPVIDSILVERVKDYAVIKTKAHDDGSGIVAYSITPDDNKPNTWKTFNAMAEYEFIQNVYEEKSYYIWVKDADGKTTRKEVTGITFNKFPKIKDELPTDLRVMKGKKASFNIEIIESGDPAECEFRWEVSEDGGATWKLIPGSTYKSYTIDKVKESDSGKLYKCVITHARGDMYSRNAKLTVFDINTDKPFVYELNPYKDAIIGGIVINGGENKTSTDTLKLKIVAVNAEEMCIEEVDKNNIPENPPEGAKWKLYKDEASYTLKNNENGEKTLKVWVRNADSTANNYSSAVASINKVN